MAILTERDRTAVQGELAKLAGPVKLIVFSSQLGAVRVLRRDRAAGPRGRGGSDQITVEMLNLHIDRERAEAYGVDRVPAIVVEGARDYGIRFFGIPMGYEFSNLIDSIIAASSGTPTLGAETLERLAGLKERRPHPGVLHPHLTPLPPGRAPGASPGGRLGLDPRRPRSKRPSSPSSRRRYHGHGRPEDRHQRPRRSSRAPCRSRSSSTPCCGRSARPTETAGELGADRRRRGRDRRPGTGDPPRPRLTAARRGLRDGAHRLRTPGLFA